MAFIEDTNSRKQPLRWETLVLPLRLRYLILTTLMTTQVVGPLATWHLCASCTQHLAIITDSYQEQLPLYERDRKAEQQGKRLIRHILSPTNVFAIGATMFELVTLERADHWFDENRGLGALGSQVMHKANDSAYSDQLIELIVDCMNAEPVDRIEIKDLYSQIKRHRDHIAKEYGCRDPKKNDRLYYKGSEINDMSPGEFVPLMEKIERPHFAERLDFIDPSLLPVRFPDLGPGAYQNEGDGPEQTLRKGDEAGEPFEIYDEQPEESRPSHIRTSEAEFAKWLGRSRTKSAGITQVEKGASKRRAKPPPLGQHVSRVCRRPLSIDWTEDDGEGAVEDAENGVGEEEGANFDSSSYAGTPGGDEMKEVLETEDAREDSEREASLLDWAGAAMKRLFSNQNVRNGNDKGDQQKADAQQHQQDKQVKDQHDSRIRSTPSWSPITNHSRPSSKAAHTGQEGNAQAHQQSNQKGDQQQDSRIRSTPSWSPITNGTLPSSQPPHTSNNTLKRSRAAPPNLALQTSPSIETQSSRRLFGTEKEEALHDENHRRKRPRTTSDKELVAETPVTSKSLNTEARGQGGSGTGSQYRAPRVDRPRRGWGPRAEW